MISKENREYYIFITIYNKCLNIPVRLTIQLLSVKEMFAKHLMQLKGVSAEKASAIVEQYPTPKWYGNKQRLNYYL